MSGFTMIGGITFEGGMFFGSEEAPTPPPPSGGWSNSSALNNEFNDPGNSWLGYATAIASGYDDNLGDNIIWISSSDGSIVRSTDYGNSWTLVTENLSYDSSGNIYVSNNISDLIYYDTGNSNRFSAISRIVNGTVYTDPIRTDANGVFWFDMLSSYNGEAQTFNFSPAADNEAPGNVIWGTNIKAAYNNAGNIYMATDGINAFVFDDGALVYSANSWISDGPANLTNFGTLASGNGIFMATGENEVWHSVDGDILSWTAYSGNGIPTTGALIPVWTGNYWVAGMNDTANIYSSIDGINWSYEGNVGQYASYNTTCVDLIYDGANLLYLGEGPAGDDYPTVVALSTDNGNSWTELGSAETDTNAGNSPRAIGYLPASFDSNAKVVIVAGETIANVAIYTF
jgi:hypothetical protein